MDDLWAWKWKWAILAAAVIVIMFGVAMRATRQALDARLRPRRVLAVIFGMTAIIILLTLQFVDVDERWLWVAALLPASFVIHHGINLAVFKNRRFFDETQEPNYSQLDPKLVPIVKAAYIQERQYYSTASLTLRFALPALVLVLVILTVGYNLLSPPHIKGYELSETFIQGLQIGGVGAYVYILLFLGGRAIRSDITPASVIWSSVTMVGGPLFAGALQLLFVSKPDQQWNALLLPFAAGFSLRFVVDLVDAGIRRVFGQPDQSLRGISLMRLRGITRDIEERLIEEGIADVSNLAMANPHRLRRNTRFDKRQITSWIDEALLMTYLPNAWQSLEADGITGAIDLVWYVNFLGHDAVRDAGKPPAPPAANLQINAFAKLAERNKLEVSALSEAVLRMHEDAQVQLIWGLYQLDETETADGDPLFEDFESENNEADRGSEAEHSQAKSPLQSRRIERYRDNQNLFVVHTWRKSADPNQVADVVIRLVQHGSDGPLTQGLVRSVEYALGAKFFAGSTITKTNARDAFSLAISAYGPALCIARVVLADNKEIYLERYLDFDIEELRTESRAR